MKYDIDYLTSVMFLATFVRVACKDIINAVNSESYENIPQIKDILVGNSLIYNTNIIKSIIFNPVTELIPHLKYDILNKSFADKIRPTWITQLLLTKYIVPFYRSTYRFVNEREYLDTIELCGIDLNTISKSDVFDNGMSYKQNIIKYLTSIVGFDMIQTFGRDADGTMLYTIDINELSKYEHRDGYWRTNGELFMSHTSTGGFKYVKLRIDGVEYDTSVPDTNLEFPFRKFMTGVFCILTVKKHLLGCHLELSDKANTLIEKELYVDHPVRRLLGFISMDPYRVNELAVNSLMGESTMCAFFTNLTKRGINRYVADSRTKFNFRSLVDVSRIILNSSGVELSTKELSYVMSASTDPSPTIDLATKQFYTIGLSTLPSGYQMCKWWNILYEFVEQFINIHYPTEYIKNDAKHFVDMMFLAYPGLEIDYKGMTYKQNLIDICVSLLNVNVVHESYSNSVFAGYAMNPFVQSTTWLENDSPDLVDHISNMQNQFTINMVFESTKVGSKCMGDDFSHLCMGYKKENELVAFGAFRNSISQLRSWFEGNNLSPEYWPLHPDNIKCSVRW
jgi:hypothetical protein